MLHKWPLAKVFRVDFPRTYCDLHFLLLHYCQHSNLSGSMTTTVKLHLQLSMTFDISIFDIFHIPPKENVDSVQQQNQLLKQLLLLLLLMLLYLATLLLWWFPLSRSISGNKCLFYTVLSDHSPPYWELRLETEARKWRQKHLTNTTSCFAFLLGHSLMLCSLPQPWSRLIQTLTLLPLRRRLPRVEPSDLDGSIVLSPATALLQDTATCWEATEIFWRNTLSHRLAPDTKNGLAGDGPSPL